MDNNLIRCSQISVDCVANDPVDIRCGGPEYLGFDFNVRVEQTEEMKKFIAVTLEIFEIPLTNLYISGTIDLSEKDVWTKERIVKAVNYVLVTYNNEYHGLGDSVKIKLLDQPVVSDTPVSPNIIVLLPTFIILGFISGVSCLGSSLTVVFFVV